MEYTELNNVCNIISRGKSVLKSNTGTIIYVGFKDIENNTINFETTTKCKLVNEYNDLKMYNIESNDIILPPITRKNIVIKQLLTLGNVTNMIYSSRAIYIRVDEQKYSSLFLYSLLSTSKYKEKLLNEVYKDSSYVDTYQISIERLKNFKIPLISLEKQKNILKQEKNINAKIQNLENQLELLYKDF